MYLHLGQNVVVPEEDIIGIFDMDTCTSAQITRRFLSAMETAGKTEGLFADIPKSFVLTEEVGDSRVYFCQFATTTLSKAAAAEAGIMSTPLS